jgi:Glucodextranase, domain B
VPDFATSRITARGIVKYTLVAVFVGCLVVYITFQARFLIIGPEVTLIHEPDSVQNSPTVTLEGNVRNIAKITLNGRQIYTDQSGYFSETLVLENGYTIATIKATDRYGRETNVVRSFVYTPTSIMTK